MRIGDVLCRRGTWFWATLSKSVLHPAVQNAAANVRTCSRSYCAPASLCRAVLGILTYIKYAPVPALRRAGRSRSPSLCDGGDPGAAHCPPGCRAACGPPQQTDPASRVPRAAFRRALQGFQALATDREQALKQLFLLFRQRNCQLFKCGQNLLALIIVIVKKRAGQIIPDFLKGAHNAVSPTDDKCLRRRNAVQDYPRQSTPARKSQSVPSERYRYPDPPEPQYQYHPVASSAPRCPDRFRSNPERSINGEYHSQLRRAARRARTGPRPKVRMPPRIKACVAAFHGQATASGI